MAEGMENKHADNERNKNDRSWLGIIIRFVVAAIVLMVTSLITPGFSIWDLELLCWLLLL